MIPEMPPVDTRLNKDFMEVWCDEWLFLIRPEHFSSTTMVAGAMDRENPERIECGMRPREQVGYCEKEVTDVRQINAHLCHSKTEEGTGLLQLRI